MYKTKKNRHKIRSKILGGLVAASVILISGFLIMRDNSKNASTDKPDSTINYSPPTKEELEETKDQKEAISPNSSPVKDDPVASTETTTTSKVVPVISSWGYSDSFLQVSGFVPGIIESTGTCTLIAISGSTRATASGPGTPNAQNVSCGLIKIPRSKLSTGVWTVTLEYESAGHKGTSEPRSQDVK